MEYGIRSYTYFSQNGPVNINSPLKVSDTSKKASILSLFWTGDPNFWIRIKKGDPVRKKECWLFIDKLAPKGFTLVELMIVVLILGALAAIAIPRIMGGAATAKTNGCKANIDRINSQIELYFANIGDWPDNLKKVTTDTDYFPDGEPRCPVTGAVYPNDLLGTNRVNASGHVH